MPSVSSYSTTAALSKWAHFRNCKGSVEFSIGLSRSSSPWLARQKSQQCNSARNSGEHRKIRITKVRGNSYRKEGRYIDRSRSTQTNGECSLRGLAARPGQTAHDNASEEPRAGTKQGSLLHHVVNALQYDKSRPIQKYLPPRPFDVGNPHCEICAGEKIPHEAGAVLDIGEQMAKDG